MPQAPRYSRATDFSSQSPDRTDHVKLNNEFDQVSESVNELVTNLAKIQADDGGLDSGVVTSRALSDEVLALVTGAEPLALAGIQGPPGQSFQPSAFDLAASRSIYDDELKGFSLMAMDTGELFFKLSDASGDWSVGHQFGAGTPGVMGVAGPAGAPGVVTDVELSTASLDLVGASTLFATLELVAGKLSLKLERGDV